MNPLVSVIIPVYNRANIIGNAIRSVLKQSYKNFEIIVVDDGSTDGSSEIVKSYSKSEIRLIQHQKNMGAQAARNTGIKNANGEFICFLDSDDEWHETKLEKQLAIFEKSVEETGVVYTGWRWISHSDGKIIQKKIPKEKGDLFVRLLEFDIIGSMSTPMIRKKYLLQSGGFDEKLPSRQDWDLWLRLSKICKFDFVPELLVDYYVHPKSISGNRRNKIAGTEMILQKYSKAFQANIKLLSRHYIVLTIMYLLENDTAKAGTYIRRSLESNPFSISNIWKNCVHLCLLIFPASLRHKYFERMKKINKDFFWIAAG